MPTTIKICGIKTAAEIEILNRYPVNHMGFIFAPSKRQVKEAQVKALRTLVRRDIEVVGVFVNENIDIVNTLIKSCQLDIVQLHGEETVDYCRNVQGRVWKSFSVKDKDSLKEIEAYVPYVEGILLDAYSPTEKGGTGKSFNWDLIKDLSKEIPVILAGGLTPENAKEAIKAVNPRTLDLNSGLETNLIKDEVKIEALFRRLKEVAQ